MIRGGDTVRVHPYGDSARAATGRVALVSDNQQSIAVAFADSVPFRFGGGLAMHPELGIVLLGMRESDAGPWTEIVSGEQFEILYGESDRLDR